MGWILIHFLWQAAGVGLMLALMLTTTRRAELRCRTAEAVLGLTLALPLITGWVLAQPLSEREWAEAVSSGWLLRDIQVATRFTAPANLAGLAEFAALGWCVWAPGQFLIWAGGIWTLNRWPRRPLPAEWADLSIRQSAEAMTMQNLRRQGGSKIERNMSITHQPRAWSLVAVLAIAVFWVFPAAAAEEAPYRVVRADGKVEIREYAPFMVAEVEMEGSREDAANRAFGDLFGYISGQNRPGRKIAMTTPVIEADAGRSPSASGEKIAMTTPVTQEPSGDRWRIAFVMPSNITPDNAPAPTNPRVQIRQQPGRRMAAIRFSGGASDSSVSKHQKALMDWAAANGLRARSAPVVAIYNPPFIPPFLRRNEILVEIE